MKMTPDVPHHEHLHLDPSSSSVLCPSYSGFAMACVKSCRTEMFLNLAAYSKCKKKKKKTLAVPEQLAQ